MYLIFLLYDALNILFYISEEYSRSIKKKVYKNHSYLVVVKYHHIFAFWHLISNILFMINYRYMHELFFGIWRSNFEIDHSLTAENRLSSYRSIAILQSCGYSNPIMIKKSIHSTIKNHSYAIESAVHENIRPYQVF